MSAVAQGSPRLVRDINTSSTVNPSSTPDLFTRLLTQVLFVARDDAHGRELWTWPVAGGSPTLVRDIDPGVADSEPSALVEVGGQVLFFATEVGFGRELWRTDGTAVGTYLVKDIAATAESAISASAALFVVGSTAYFAADSRTGDGEELWRTDGTAAGTLRVANIHPSGSSSPSEFATLGALVFFSATTSTQGRELWRTDGTAAGTSLVADINPTSASSTPRHLTRLGTSTLLFSATTSSSGNELWRTDGTAAGTTRVKDIAPTATSSSPDQLTRFGAHVYFAATTVASGRELWRSDGTEAGTIQVAEIAAAADSSSPTELAATSAGLYFAATTPSTGREMYASDGTASGTILLADIVPGSGSSNPNGLTASSQLFTRHMFAADDGAGGRDLWFTIGTQASTIKFADFSGGASSPGAFFEASTSRFLFRAGHNGNVELWHTDQSVRGTTEVADLYPSIRSSAPASFADAGGPTTTSYFAAAQGTLGRELWRTDGTSAGTVLVLDINPTLDAGSDPSDLVMMAGRLYFTADDGTHGRELWTSDGTPAGTFMVRDIHPTTGSSPSELTVFRGRLFFAASQSGSGPLVKRNLWASDGTSAGTTQISNALPNTGSHPTDLTVVKDALFFRGASSEFITVIPVDYELWKTDGTVAGTTRVKDIWVGVDSSSPSSLVNFKDTLYFAASNQLGGPFTLGRELWRSDGTAAGTVSVANIALSSDSSPDQLTVVGESLFFVATDGLSGRELYRSDGTTAGTVLVADIAPGTAGSHPRHFSSVGAVAVFSATTAGTGYEPWRSDGTAAGTFRLADVHAGPYSSMPSSGFVYAPPGAGRCLFAATDGTGEVYLWRTDGTVAGTVRHSTFGYNPSAPTQAGCLLLWSARLRSILGDVGVELAAMASLASASPYGTSCAGSAGNVPHIYGAGGAPFVGNPSFRVGVTSTLPTGSSVLLLHFGRGEIPLGGGCTYYVNPAMQLLSAFVPVVGGTGSLGLPIPNNPNLHCLELFGQHAVLDPNGAYNNQIAFTEGLRILIADT